MTHRTILLVHFTGLAFCACIATSTAYAVEVAKAALPAKEIGAGQPRWVDSAPQDPLLNARVDLGTLRAVGDEIEVTLRWAIGPGLLNDLRLESPGLRIPPGSYSLDVERIRCMPKGLMSYAVHSTLTTPDGVVLRQKNYDPALQRKDAESSPYGISTYGTDPRSLVCWALARRCEGKSLSWPPPPNLTPLGTH